MPRPAQRIWYISGVYVGDLKFTDQQHGRTAPSFFRKHCGGCGKTLPNRSRSWICRDCYPVYRTEMKRLAETRRRDRVPGG
jgi:hypothetical protein